MFYSIPHIDYQVEQRRAAKHRNRARRMGRNGNLTLGQWMWLLIAYRFRCAYCGEPYETMDRILPLCNGGHMTKENVVPACDRCNQNKGTAVWLPARAGEGCYGH